MQHRPICLLNQINSVISHMCDIFIHYVANFYALQREVNNAFYLTYSQNTLCLYILSPFKLNRSNFSKLICSSIGRIHDSTAEGCFEASFLTSE